MKNYILRWVVVILIVSITNIIITGILGRFFGLKPIDAIVIYFSFMAGWVFAGWCRRWKYAREYRKSLKEFLKQIEGSKNGN